ncbi:MAG TPA: prepilin-type N-terminal cleavage/methylation domain-containing protein [Actinomycetota bacterium]|nr:prepilin-type N-terminal cleavage/methylation domain-containing protein [Actinomycetota bacterium]
MQDRSQSGFTIVELLAVIVIGAVLVTLGAGALRDYTRGKALQGARDTTVTQLRELQQRTFSEGYPRAYGIRFLKEDVRWDVVRYDASTGSCSVVESHKLTNGVTISGTPAETDFPESAVADACRGAIPNYTGEYEVVLFYARGTATGGKVTFELDGTGKTRPVQVNAATGRVS